MNSRVQAKEAEENFEKLWESIRRGKKLINALPRVSSETRKMPVLKVATPSETVEIYLRVFSERLRAAQIDSEEYQNECWRIIELSSLILDTASRNFFVTSAIKKLNQVPQLLNWNENYERIFFAMWTSYSKGECTPNEATVITFLSMNPSILEKMLTVFDRVKEEYRLLALLAARNKRVLSAIISVQKSLLKLGQDLSNWKGVGRMLKERNPDIYLNYPPVLQPALVLDDVCRINYISENVEDFPDEFLMLFLHFPEILKELLNLLKGVRGKNAFRILWQCFKVNLIGLDWPEICSELRSSEMMKLFAEEICVDEAMEVSQ